MDGGRIELSEREVELLRYLANNAGRAIARDELLANVWRISPRGLATRTIDMLEPFSLFGDRVRQMDMRVSKLFRFGAQRIQANLDIYNVANASTATFLRNTYTAPGAVTTTPWQQPTQVMDGRFVKFSAQFDF